MEQESYCDSTVVDSESTTKESDSLTTITEESTVTTEEYTSMSSDESLGLLSESQIESAFYSDTESEDIFSNFQPYKVVVQQFSQNINLRNSKCDKEISPICSLEKSSTIDPSLLESTPRIKQSVHEISKKFSTSYHQEDILNKTVNLKSVWDDRKNETFIAVESDEECTIDYNILNMTHPIEREDEKSETSLNRTFGALNILNKTLPSVISTMESPSYVLSEKKIEEIDKNNIQNKTFTESPEKIHETRSYACDPKKHELPVQAKHSQETLSRTVTKIKNKKNLKPTENKPHSSSSNILDSQSIPSIPKVNETDFSQTGVKQKIFKTDRGKPKLKKCSSKTDSTLDVINKPRKVLSTTNRDLKVLKSSSAFDKDSSMSSGHTVDPEIPPQNITIPRGNFRSKNVLQKKAPINLSFKKVDKVPLSQKEIEKLHKEEILLKNEDYMKKRYKESAKLPGYADYKLSLYGSIKEIETAKNRRELLDIPTIRLVEEPYTDQRILSRSTSARPVVTSSARPVVTSSADTSGTSDIAEKQQKLATIPKHQDRLQGRRNVLPLPSREIVHPTHQRMPGDYQRRPSYRRGFSGIPTLRQRAFGPQAVFGIGDPFDPPVRGRRSTVQKKRNGSNEPSSQN